MNTKMYLVEQREDWKPGDCYVCKFTCKAAFNLNPACPMSKSKEAVEVMAHLPKPVRLFCVEEK